jgi:alkanesulfonate monooxygenase SsuD/methylene tetrahydromethanopterin reductase-like flavin-dependent oxidoreductase (luciferase family)
VQHPHPPICIGGSGPNRTLRSVARWAQHWNHPGGSPEQLATSIEILHERCAEIGRDPAEILISTHLHVDVDDPAAIEEQVTAAAGAGVQLGIVYLPTPHTPAVLEPLASVLAPLSR